jgi:branched-chain amino acid transport system permease protein
LPSLLMMAIGALAAVPAGVLVGGLAVRLRGVNLAVVTLAFGVAITAVFARYPFPGILDAKFRPLRPQGFTSNRMYFLLCAFVLIVIGVALEWLGRRRIGQAWRAVRSSERATAAAGFSVPMVKLSAFIVSALIAGVAGSLYAGQLEGSVDLRSFLAVGSMVAVAAAVMMGAQSLSGAVLAGLLAAMIPEIFGRLDWPIEIPQIIFGLGAIQALSKGGAGISADFPWRRPIPSPSPAPSPPAPIVEGAAAVDGSRAPVLELKGLTVRYGALTALNDVSLTVPPATVVGVIGPNGAGKSTLVDAVCGFVDRYGGEVLLNGTRIDQLTASKRARTGLRRTFQQGRAIPELTVGEYVRLYSPTPIADAALEEVLGYFDLPAADQPIVFVDVGTRRILEVAAAVANRPVVAFLDEPAAGLGADQAAALGERIKGIPARFSSSVVLIEHNVELVANACSHVTVLDFGIVIARGTAQEVLNDPRVAAAYLGEEIDLPHEAGVAGMPGGGA